MFLHVSNVAEVFQRNKGILYAKGELQPTKEMLSSFVCDLEVIQLEVTTLSAKAGIKENDYHRAINNFHNHDTQFNELPKLLKFFNNNLRWNLIGLLI